MWRVVPSLISPCPLPRASQARCPPGRIPHCCRAGRPRSTAASTSLSPSLLKSTREGSPQRLPHRGMTYTTLPPPPGEGRRYITQPPLPLRQSSQLLLEVGETCITRSCMVEIVMASTTWIEDLIIWGD